MNWLAISALIAALCANSLANIVLKAGSGTREGIALYLSPYFIGACGLFGLNLVAYTYALKFIPLSVAYPVLVGGSVVFIVLAATLIFHETPSWQHLAGMALIIAGAALVVR